jgi:hypothetical protein
VWVPGGLTKAEVGAIKAPKRQYVRKRAGAPLPKTPGRPSESKGHGTPKPGTPLQGAGKIPRGGGAVKKLERSTPIKKAKNKGKAAGPSPSKAPETQPGASTGEARLLTERAPEPLGELDEFLLKKALEDAKNAETSLKRYDIHKSGLKMKKYLVPRGPCAECGTKTTSEWRPTDGLELCNACGLRARARKRGVPKAGPNKHQKGSVVQQKRYTAAMKDLRRETEMLKRENKERERLGFPLLPTKKDLMKARGTLPPAPKSNQKKSNQKKSNQKKSNQKRSDQKKSDQKKSDQKKNDQKKNDQKKSTQKKTKEKKGKKVLGGTQKSKTPRRSGATAKSQGALAQMPALLHAIETAELPEAQPWPEELLQEAGLAAGPPKETDGTDGTVEKRKQRGKANAKEGGNQKIRAAGSAGTGEQPPYQRNDTEDQTIAEFLALIKDAPEAARSTPAEKRGGGALPQAKKKRAKTQETQAPTSPWAEVPQAPLSRRGRTPRPSVRLGVPGTVLKPNTPQGAQRPEPAPASAPLAFLVGAMDQLPSSPKK